MYLFNNYLGYEGKVCIVTGVSSDIGRATTKILVDLGAKVYAIARRDSGVELMVDYCDNAMKKIGQKEELCRFPALPSDEELAKFRAQNNN